MSTDAITFSKAFRARLSEKLMELGNISLGSLVFVPIISEINHLSVLFASMGLVVALVSYTTSYIISN